MNQHFRVLVVDDSVLPRVAARAMLAASEDLRLCGEAASGEEALATVASLRPDLVLMDVEMPGMDGTETTKRLLSQFPQAKVVAWTVSESSDDLLRMLQAGCAGYVLKDVGPSELHRALTAAMRSESPLPRKMIPAALKRAVAQIPADQAATAVRLTTRETDVLRAMAKGHTTKRIAAELKLRPPSVASHVRNILRKLGAGNRGEAVSAALKLGLLTLADL